MPADEVCVDAARWQAMEAVVAAGRSMVQRTSSDDLTEDEQCDVHYWPLLWDEFCAALKALAAVERGEGEAHGLRQT